MQKADPDKKPELGMQQHCRDNVTMFQAKKIIGGLLSYIMSLFSVATPFRHRGFNNFSGPWCSILLSRCRCREAKKLSRAQLCSFELFRVRIFWNLMYLDSDLWGKMNENSDMLAKFMRIRILNTVV